MATSNFLKFHQFSKMEDGKDDDMPTVWGVATWEQPDSDNECCDYDSAKPVYQAWSAKALKRTKGAGQDISLGNIRLQHGMEVGGKATKLEFDDKAREIWLGSEPISDDVKKQLKGGFYTGYSQGGSYAWRACKECETPLAMQQGANYCPSCDKTVTVMYGLRRLAEVSYVDSPATGEGFEHVKANGSTEILKFAKKENAVAKTKRVAGEDLEASAFAYVGDPEKTDTWKLPIKFSNADKTKRHVRNALARLDQTKGIPSDKKDEVKAKIHAAATAHGIDVNDPSSKSDKVCEMMKSRIETKAKERGIVVQKDMYSVGRTAEILQSLMYLYESAMWEREIEGDGSEVPNDLGEVVDDLCDVFLAMATEEATELAAQIKGKTSTGEKAMTPEQIAAQQELEKAAKKSLATHFAKSAAHHEKMADVHENMAAIHEKADVGCKDCMGKADTAKAARVTAAKADAVAKGEVYKEDVGSGATHDDIHEVVANQQEFHKAMAKEHMKKAKAHDKLAEHLSKMAESHDEETAKTVKAEIVAFDLTNPEPKVEKAAPVVEPPVPAEGTMESDILKAAAAKRKSPEYLEQVNEMADQILQAELAKKRETMLAPFGVQIDKETGEGILKTGGSLKIVPREDGKEFAFATESEGGKFAGV